MSKLVKKRTLVRLYFIEIYKHLCVTFLGLLGNLFVIDFYECTLIELINEVFFKFLLIFGSLEYEISYNTFEYSLHKFQDYLIIFNLLIQMTLLFSFIVVPASKYSLLKYILQAYALLSFLLVVVGVLLLYMGANLYFYFAYIDILNDSFDPYITLNDFNKLLIILFTVQFELFFFLLSLKIVFLAKISIKLMRTITFYILILFVIMSFKIYLFEDLVLLTMLLLLYREFNIYIILN